MLDTSFYEKAILQLEKCLAKTAAAKREGDVDSYQIYRTAGLKAFEFTYELSIKMLKRALKAADFSADTVEKMLFRPLMRAAAEKGVIEEPLRWVVYRDNRNKTVHGYAEDVAEEIFAKLPAFLESAQFLLAYLNKVAKDVY